MEVGKRTFRNGKEKDIAKRDDHHYGFTASVLLKYLFSSVP
jgi:hypothetical protein